MFGSSLNEHVVCPQYVWLSYKTYEIHIRLFFIATDDAILAQKHVLANPVIVYWSKEIYKLYRKLLILNSTCLIYYIVHSYITFK